ncbi:ABC transporter substrate-binding protein [Acetobacter sp.]|uniref:ABC transporter substrate-binding protein n=1 Tax=Acetobacter sp. TaxID=440 RepID=UPI0025C68F20|nr:ABC transporter substrate-binding protein [Acetobacter sp.]MCH4092664.1 ABC transporter substrate-binding protein [Acetobacter sp.]MCI1301234.1 ABC transporter substrate-binding protein [Acetobacter sp.]MCI1317495.1 ABC transporter substrate-binding protein [Acetobacter sp.]
MPRSLHAEELSSVTLRVASFRGMDSTLLPATGLADFPYKVEFSEFNSGNLIAQAINADAVDLGEWSEIPLAFIAASGARVKVVAAVDGPTTNQAVIVPANSPARSFVDLKNRKIGYIRSTTAHYFLIRMLAKVGLTLADITPVPLGMSQGLAALKSGSIDAWATYGYVIPMLVGDGAARILESAENILSGHYFIGANPVRLPDPAFRLAAADYLNRLGKAYALLTQNKEKWAKVISPVIQIPEDIVLSDLKAQNHPYHMRPWTETDIQSAQAVVDTFIEQRIIVTRPDLKSVFSNDLAPLLKG